MQLAECIPCKSLMYIGISVREFGGGTAWDRVEMGQCPLTPPTQDVQDVQVNWIFGSLPAYDLFIMSFLPSTSRPI